VTVGSAAESAAGGDCDEFETAVALLESGVAVTGGDGFVAGVDSVGVEGGVDVAGGADFCATPVLVFAPEGEEEGDVNAMANAPQNPIIRKRSAPNQTTFLSSRARCPERDGVLVIVHPHFSVPSGRAGCNG